MAVYLDSSFGQWKLPQGVSILGRGADCAIRLDDLRLSRHHAELILDGQHLVVRDLGSTNGVLVDGDRIQEDQVLKDGTSMTLGPFGFTIRYAADERDPSRIASEAVAQGSRGGSGSSGTRKGSEEFSPSTDRASRADRRTMDMDQGLPTPVAKPQTAPAASLHNHEDASPALTERRSDRRIAPVIEQALQDDEEIATPLPSASKQRDTDALMPSQQGTRRKSDALMPIDEGGRIIVDAEAQLSLNPLAVDDAPLAVRMWAMIGDGVIILLISVMILALGLVGGFFAAQRILGLEAGDMGPWWDQMLAYHHDGGLAWISFISLSAAGVIVAAMCFVLLIIGGTTLRGGPWCHRRLGLVIIDQRSGHFPTPYRCAARSLLGIVSAPLIPIFLMLGLQPLHDRLCRCQVRFQSKAGA